MTGNSYIHQSKLFSLLNTLSTKELKEFEAWLSSPVHNSSVDVLQYYQSMLHQGKCFDLPISKQKLLVCAGFVQETSLSSKEISPQHETAIKKINHKLTEQLQDYLVWKRFRENSFQSKRILMDVLLARKLGKEISPILKRAKKKLTSSPIRDISYCENNFLLTEMEFYIRMMSYNKAVKTDVQQVIDTLGESFLSKLLRYYCAAKSRENVLKKKYKYPFLEAVKQYLENSESSTIPVIKVYYELLKLLEEEKEEDFYELKNYLFQNIQAFDIGELRQFLNHLTNYCSWRVKEGKMQFLEQKQEIHELGLSLQCWSTGLHFSDILYLHIAKTALSLQKVEWADNFAESYKKSLNPLVRANISNFYFALSFFQKKEIQKAHDHLIQVNSTEGFAYYLEYKILLIKIYYDLKEINTNNYDTHPINYELEAIRHFTLSVRNKKMSETLRQSYNNFIKIFKSILERHKKILFNDPPNLANIHRLKDKLKRISPIIELEWLEEKMKELEGQVS